MESKRVRILSDRPILPTAYDMDLFVGRANEFEKAIEVIFYGENLLIIGDRGSGKTSFLNYLKYFVSRKDLLWKYRTETKKILPIFIDFFEHGEQFTREVFLQSLIKGIFRELSKNEQLKNTLSVSEKWIKEKTDFIETLDMLQNLSMRIYDEGYHLIYFYDNLDKINGRDIWTSLRGIRDALWVMQFSLVFSLASNQFKYIYKPPLDRFFPYIIRLGPLSRRDIKKFIDKRLGPNFHITNDVLDLIIERTQGNPLSILLIIRSAYESLGPEKEGKKISFTISDLDSNYKFNLSKYMSQLSSSHKNVMQYLMKYDGVSASDKEFIKEIGLGRSRLTQILKELLERGLLSSKKKGRKKRYFISRVSGEDKSK